MLSSPCKSCSGKRLLARFSRPASGGCALVSKKHGCLGMVRIWLPKGDAQYAVGRRGCGWLPAGRVPLLVTSIPGSCAARLDMAGFNVPGRLAQNNDGACFNTATQSLFRFCHRVGWLLWDELLQASISMFGGFLQRTDGTIACISVRADRLYGFIRDPGDETVPPRAVRLPGVICIVVPWHLAEAMLSGICRDICGPSSGVADAYTTIPAATRDRRYNNGLVNACQAGFFFAPHRRIDLRVDYQKPAGCRLFAAVLLFDRSTHPPAGGASSPFGSASSAMVKCRDRFALFCLFLHRQSRCSFTADAKIFSLWRGNQT